jgi:hypothetical protein
MTTHEPNAPSSLRSNDQPKPAWVWWSTHETIANEKPSVTAVVETIVAVPVYWWIALHVGLVLPLLISAAVAPLVLLRSEQSVARGVRWFLWIERATEDFVMRLERRSLLLTIATLICLILIASTSIRFAATICFIQAGLQELPRNFRRIVICTSPAQIPELVPGLENTVSTYKVSRNVGDIFQTTFAFLCVYWPAWLYRITIKSTAWFWWPLAFLGGDLKRVQNPALFHWEVMGSLWARTSIVLACFSLFAFGIAHFGTLVFGENDLLIPAGRLLALDWTSLWSWQVFALMASVLSLALVFLVNDVSGRYRIAQEHGDAKLLAAAQSRFGWIERLARVRFLVLLVFWGLVGTHALLYVNSQQCWFSLSPELQTMAKRVYGDRLPRSDKCLDLH